MVETRDPQAETMAHHENAGIQLATASSAFCFLLRSRAHYVEEVGKMI